MLCLYIKPETTLEKFKKLTNTIDKKHTKIFKNAHFDKDFKCFDVVFKESANINDILAFKRCINSTLTDKSKKTFTNYVNKRFFATYF